jgi:ribosomal-protein-alanine N-acetyltransferase
VGAGGLPEGYRIEPLRQEDSPALAAAYRRNREHLAEWDPVRAESFFTDQGHAEEVRRLLAVTGQQRQYVWVLWHGDEVAGRVTINNIVRGVLQSATIGYWVDAGHLRRGLATAMVEHVVGEARRLGLHRLEAGTMLRNQASQRVLRAAGFSAYGLAEKFLYIAGAWEDHVLFQRILGDEPAGNPPR